MEIKSLLDSEIDSLFERSYRKYVNYAETWGLTLAFSQTNSVQKAEDLLSETMVNLAVQKQPTTLTQVHFAKSLLTISSKFATDRELDIDGFFSLPKVTRAVSVLKSRAKFQEKEIADVLNISVKAVEMHLEKSRLFFSKSKTWFKRPSDIIVTNSGKEIQWNSECPYWSKNSDRSSLDQDLQTLFSQYITNDLDAKTEKVLYGHFAVCKVCRENLVEFKDKYNSWVESHPYLEPTRNLSRRIQKYYKDAFHIQWDNRPNFWLGIKEMLNNPMHLIVFAFVAMLAFIFAKQ